MKHFFNEVVENASLECSPVMSQNAITAAFLYTFTDEV